MNLLASLDQASHWRNLRALGNSTLAKATSIIPLLGALLLYNYNVLHLLELFGRADRTCEWGSCIPFWNTHLLYFGSCSIAVATIIYALRCPERVKKYESPVEYTTAETKFFTHGHHVGYYPILVRADAKEFGFDINNHFSTIDSDDDDRIDAGRILPMMTEHYEALDGCRRGSRISTFLFYIAGFGLVSIPTILTFFKVAIEVVWRMVSH